MGKVWLGKVGWCWEWHGEVVFGMVWQNPRCEGRGPARHGEVWWVQAWRGLVGSGKVWQNSHL